MLHLFFGDDAVTVRQKANAFADKSAQGGMKIVRIEPESYEVGSIAHAVGSMSLFGEKTLYLIDTPSLEEELNKEVEEMLGAMRESETVFVVIETKLLAAAKKTYEKFTNTSEEIKGVKEASFNVFALADSLSQKDKKTLWLGLTQAKAAGLSAEEIIGTLWWQLKTLRLAARTATAEEAGMKDFPYNKAKRSVRNFKEGELETFSQSLLSLYHDGHLGKRDIDIALEKWTLSL